MGDMSFNKLHMQDLWLLHKYMKEEKYDELRCLLMFWCLMNLGNIFLFPLMFLCKFHLISCFNEDILYA